MKLNILLETDHYWIVDKPAGVQVHPPEDKRFKLAFHHNGLALLREQTGLYVWPVHRLDRATSGCVIYAKKAEYVSKLQKLFVDSHMEKTYFALIRGWLQADELTVTHPIKYESSFQEAQSHIKNRHRFSMTKNFVKGEWPLEESRYSIVELRPITGRHHQLRRHLKSLHHPIIGDTVYGDGLHNRSWAALMNTKKLYLKARELSFHDPWTGNSVCATSEWEPEWLAIFEISKCMTNFTDNQSRS